MLVKITLFAALLLSIVVPFAYFLSGTKNKARYKLTIGTNAAAFFGIMLVACGFMFSGNAQAAEAAAQTLLKEQLDEVLDTLTEREQKVLRLRFGMNDGRARTLEEVGKEFDFTRERIRQIEAKALRKLRHPSRSRKLRDYLD